jgi:hypothetical protein
MSLVSILTSSLRNIFQCFSVVQQSSKLIMIFTELYISCTLTASEFHKPKTACWINFIPRMLQTKVTFSLLQATKAEEVYRYSTTLPLTSKISDYEWLKPNPGPFTLGVTRYLLYRRVGGPEGRSGRVRNNSPPSGYDPLSFQSVTSRYTG